MTGRCVPHAKMIVMFSSFTPAAFSSSRTGGTINWLGAGLVTSSTTIATLLSGFTISPSFFEPSGSLRALWISACGSCAPGFSFGSMEPKKFRVGTLTQTSDFP